MDAAEVVRTLMLSAVQAAGLPDAGYDLTAALGLVLADPDAERRWLEGEDMLASLRANPRSEAARAMQGRLGARIGAITG